MPNTEEIISRSDAQKISEEKGITISIPGIIAWIQKHNLGYQIGGEGGRWMVYKERFIKFIEGR